MAQQHLAAEYHLLLTTIERLAFEYGQIEAETDELQRRMARLESRVANLSQPASATVIRPHVQPSPSINKGNTGIDRSVASERVEQALSASDSRPASVVFTRLTPSPAVAPQEVPAPTATIPVSSALVRVEPQPATVREPFWSRVPDRYRRAAWIAAPIAVVMVVSTWVTTAGTPDADPTATVQIGISNQGTATVDRPGTPLMVTRTVASSIPLSTREPGSPIGGQVGLPTATSASPSATSTRPQPTATATGATEATAGATAVTETGTEIVEPTPTATVTVEPTATATATAPPTPTVAAGPVELIAGGVGSTQTTVVETFGLASGEQDGRSVYSEGSVLITHGPETRAVHVTFLLNLDDFTMSLAEAEDLIAYYRPPDAQLLSTDNGQPGVIRRVYQSPTLTALFAGQDTSGRANDRYVEELHFDPTSQRALTADMALGDQP